MTQRETALGRLMWPEVDVDRPVTRADCAGIERPCPFVSCAHHLYLDVSTRGSIKLNFPDLEPGDLRQSCALDVADRGGFTLEAVGAAMNITRERVRQIEVVALARARHSIAELGDFVPPNVVPIRTLPKDVPMPAKRESKPKIDTALVQDVAERAAKSRALAIEALEALERELVKKLEETRAARARLEATG